MSEEDAYKCQYISYPSYTNEQVLSQINAERLGIVTSCDTERMVRILSERLLDPKSLPASDTVLAPYSASNQSYTKIEEEEAKVEEKEEETKVEEEVKLETLEPREYTVVEEFVSENPKTLGDIISNQEKRMRLIPHVSQIPENMHKPLSDPSAMFSTNPENPSELVTLYCTRTISDITPMLIDVIDDPSITALTDEKGWTLTSPYINVKQTIPVKFMEGGNIFSQDKWLGNWSIKKENGFALWQQPRNWSMICRRQVSHRIQIKIPSEYAEVYMVMLYDTSTERYYLQQECSFFQQKYGAIRMVDIFGHMAWSAEPIYE
jgi:hypothetical protein